MQHPFLCPSAAALLLISVSSQLSAATLVFGSNANGLQGETAATLPVGDLQMQLTAMPPGATFYENGAAGLGVNSRSASDAMDGEIDKFNVLGGTSPLAGDGESVTFSFDGPGVLTELDFDGVKDEDYEYFLLQTATSPDLYFFDSFLGSLADPGQINVPGQIVFLQEGNATIDDRSPPLAIPFVAGQIFTLTYGQQGSGNGARWQGISVTSVPEAGGLRLVVAAALLLGVQRPVPNRSFPES